MTMSESALSASEFSRRDFVAVSVAGGLGATVAGSASAETPVSDQAVTIKTPDGNCDALFIHPTTGAHPGVVLWADAFGVRPAVHEVAKRLAEAGYAVLVPNPYYRVSKAPQYETAANVDFKDNAMWEKLKPLRESINAAGAPERDAAAFVAFLDAQAAVDKGKKIGTQGYCMGGALALRSAAAVPARIGAVASFHGGGLVTDKPDSPHLLAPKVKGRVLLAIAQNDDQKQPDAKDKLKEAFAAAKVPAEIEVYPAQHGWCMPDMPVEGGKPIYSKPEAERAWSRLLVLYKAALV
jgi:carboxymethylenebutenolidase